jgi:hypothetical protein
MGDFIAHHLHANNERRQRPRSLLRRLRDALTPDTQYDIDGACFQYETGDFKLESDAYVSAYPSPRDKRADPPPVLDELPITSNLRSFSSFIRLIDGNRAGNSRVTFNTD